nr:peptidase S74 domain-containing protein [Candidatus Liberibacter asiaticus]
MKCNVKPVPNLYQYRYLSDPKNVQRIGVIAQEIIKIRPDTVVENNQGIKSVDYGRLFNIGQIQTKQKKNTAQIKGLPGGKNWE